MKVAPYIVAILFLRCCCGLTQKNDDGDGDDDDVDVTPAYVVLRKGKDPNDCLRKFCVQTFGSLMTHSCESDWVGGGGVPLAVVCSSESSGKTRSLVRPCQEQEQEQLRRTKKKKLFSFKRSILKNEL